MTANAIASMVLTALLSLAVMLRLSGHDGSSVAADPMSEPIYPVVGVHRTNFEGVEGLVFQAPWCTEPIDILFVPAYLSAIDLRTLSWPGGEFATYYVYGGHRLPNVGLSALLTTMHFYYRFAGALQLTPQTPSNAYALKLFVPISCRDDVEAQISEMSGQLASLRGAHPQRVD